MGALPRAFEDTVKRAIRDALAVDPLISQSALIEHLNKQFSHSFDYRYIRRLTDKITGQLTAELDRTSIEKRINSLKETHRIAREALLRILLWSPDPNSPVLQRGPSAQAIAEAAKNLVMLDIAVLNAEVANGIHKDLKAASKTLSYPPLPDQSREQLTSAFSKWGVLPTGFRESVIVHATRVITPEASG